MNPYWTEQLRFTWFIYSPFKKIFFYHIKMWVLNIMQQDLSVIIVLYCIALYILHPTIKIAELWSNKEFKFILLRQYWEIKSDNWYLPYASYASSLLYCYNDLTDVHYKLSEFNISNCTKHVLLSLALWIKIKVFFFPPCI